MNALMKLIDKGNQLLGHSLHPMIVTLPLGAWAVSVVSDTLGWITGRRSYDDSARISMAVGLAGATGAVVTGLHDYSAIPTDRQPSHSIATRHAIGNAVVGTLFATSFILRLERERRGQSPPVSARLLTLAGGGLMLYTGWLGGKLVEELGEGVKPVMRQREGQEHRPIAGRQVSRADSRMAGL